LRKNEGSFLVAIRSFLFIFLLIFLLIFHSFSRDQFHSKWIKNTLDIFSFEDFFRLVKRFIFKKMGGSIPLLFLLNPVGYFQQ